MPQALKHLVRPADNRIATSLDTTDPLRGGFATHMTHASDDIITEMSEEGPRLEFVSVEDGKQERVKCGSLSFASLADCRCLASVELERQPGQTTVASAEGPDSGAGKLRAAAQATLETVRRSVDASPKAFELVGIKAVTVFGKAAVIVAVAFRYDGKEKRMVGFCVIDDDHPLRAAPLAVLNATNRFLGPVLAGKITWQKSNLQVSLRRKEKGGPKPALVGSERFFLGS